MTWDHVRVPLPSGAYAVRAESDGGRLYRIHGAPVLLTARDVEALFADSIAGSGGRELARAAIMSRALRWAHPRCLACNHGAPHYIAAGQDICTDPDGCDCECYIADSGQ